MTVTFSPLQPSPGYNYTGTVTITSNAPAVTINMSGAGAPHQVDLSWIAPGGSSVPISLYNVYRAPRGTSSFAVLDSMDAQTAFTDSSIQSGQSYNYYVTSVDSAGVESSPSNMTTVIIP
jgi:fibronectin type 3 domain-containing protein